MDDRFAVRLKEMLNQTEVPPTLLDGMLDRLADFAKPYAALLSTTAQHQHLRAYVAGLLSRLERKTGEAIAYLHDQERQGLQKFLGHVPWDHQPLVALLAQQVGTTLGEPDGVLVFDPSAFAKKGTQSVGVARQWCGRLGKVENCQVGVYLGYVARQDHALVDVRLYLPQEWTKHPKRCRAAGVPKGTRFRTRHDLALAMLDTHRAVLPHAWIAGDDEMGRSSSFRAALRERGEHYLLAVPSNTRVRDQEAAPPPYTGRGRRPQAPWTRVAAWAAALPASAWTRLEVRAGTKGPLVIEAVQRRVRARAGTATGPEEVLVVTRERQGDGSVKHDYYLGHAPPGTALAELVRVAKAEHRIEECLQRGKSQAGLGDYQVRHWRGWHHHQVLSLLAAWFLSEETRRGKKPDADVDGAAGARRVSQLAGGAVAERLRRHALPPHQALVAAQRVGPLLSPSCA